MDDPVNFIIIRQVVTNEIFQHRSFKDLYIAIFVLVDFIVLLGSISMWFHVNRRDLQGALVKTNLN